MPRTRLTARREAAEAAGLEFKRIDYSEFYLTETPEDDESDICQCSYDPSDQLRYLMTFLSYLDWSFLDDSGQAEKMTDILLLPNEILLLIFDQLSLNQLLALSSLDRQTLAMRRCVSSFVYPKLRDKFIEQSCMKLPRIHFTFNEDKFDRRIDMYLLIESLSNSRHRSSFRDIKESISEFLDKNSISMCDQWVPKRLFAYHYLSGASRLNYFKTLLKKISKTDYDDMYHLRFVVVSYTKPGRSKIFYHDRSSKRKHFSRDEYMWSFVWRHLSSAPTIIPIDMMIRNNLTRDIKNLTTGVNFKGSYKIHPKYALRYKQLPDRLASRLDLITLSEMLRTNQDGLFSEMMAETRKRMAQRQQKPIEERTVMYPSFIFRAITICGNNKYLDPVEHKWCETMDEIETERTWEERQSYIRHVPRPKFPEHK